MKIIEILDKIARGEQPPKKILYKCDDEEYIFEYNEYNFDYQNEWGVWLFENICFDGENHLNKEVEILEITITNKQDKIELLRIFDETDLFDYRLALNQIIRKINEIIDYIQKE